ncbi:MAG: hypothetical protein AAFW69_10525 [Pseudomonadota bacterium]
MQAINEILDQLADMLGFGGGERDPAAVLDDLRAQGIDPRDLTAEELEALGLQPIRSR